MKARTGYVSNSSSSSFTVVLGEHPCFAKVTEEQEQLLLKQGFRYIAEEWRSSLLNGSPTYESRDKMDGAEPTALVKDVVSNADEVEDFLFDARIPFVEDAQYGTWIVQYDGRHNYYDTFFNAGINFLMYGFSNDGVADIKRRQISNTRPFCRTRITDEKDITSTALAERKQYRPKRNSQKADDNAEGTPQ